MQADELTCAVCGASSSSERGTCACGGVLVTQEHHRMITRLARRCRDAERVRRHGLMLVAAAIASFVVSLLVAAQGALDAVTMLGMLFGAPMVAVGSLRAWSAQRELGRAREPFELPSARVI